jgi:2-amino-4-hydroxy-6-hydroxymethyldihydropteridine diphosphokinase
MQDVYLSLGSNRGNRENNLLQACRKISRKIGDIIRVSSIYETEPWGFTDDILFYNQALLVTTMLTPDELIDEIQQIESEAGRIREVPAGCSDSSACPTNKYSSRPLDIDILFYGGMVLFTEKLMIPHPLMHDRRFALIPLNEIAPDMIHPVFRKSVADLLLSCNDTSKVNKIGGTTLSFDKVRGVN